MPLPQPGAGLSSSFGFATETTNGTAITPTHFLEFNNESLTMEKKTVQGMGLRAGGLYLRKTRRVVGSWGAKGSVNFDAPFNGLGLLIQHMIGSFGTTAVQQSSSAAYLQQHVPGSLAGKTFTAQVAKPDATGTLNPFTYVGCKVVDWSLATEINKYAVFDVGIDAWQELTPDNSQGTTAGPALTTPTYTTGEQFFHFRQGTIYNGGTLSTSAGITTLTSPTAAARISKINVKCTNPLATERLFVAGTAGTGGSGIAGVKGEQLENGYRQISGQLDAEFFSRASYYDTFAADSDTTLELIFTGPIIASTFAYELAILIPDIRYDGESPKVPGPGLLELALPFTGLDDEADNPVQITYQSTDVAV